MKLAVLLTCLVAARGFDLLQQLFVELGLARCIQTGTAALYDAGLEPHQHAVCRRCGRVQDVEGSIDSAALLGAAQASGFQHQGAEVIIMGVCAECAAAEAA